MTDTTLPEPPTAPPPGWEGLFEPGERILWQGRPSGRILWADLLSPLTLMGVFFTGFALFWINAASSMGTPRNAPAIFHFFPLFGIPFVLAGLYMLGGRVVWDAVVRRATHYTLTDRAAYIASALPWKRSLDRHDLDKAGPLSLDDGTPGTVWFGETVRRTEGGYRNGRYHAPQTIRTRIGFRQIDGARTVFGLMRDAMKDRQGD